MIIESFSNPKVKQLQQLLHSRKHRKESDIFVLESPKIIHECLAKNPDDIVAILCPEGDEVEYEKVPVWVLKRSLFLEVVSTVTPQPLLALVRKPKWKTNSVLKAAKRILLLDGVRDPHNIGAVLRNIKAFGMDALIVTEETVDAFHPKVCRSSAGAVMSIPVLPFSSDTLEILRKESVAFSIIAAGGTASITQLDCSEKQVFILQPVRRILLTGGWIVIGYTMPAI